MDAEQRAREIIDAHFYQYASSLQKPVYDAIAAALREAYEDGAQEVRQFAAEEIHTYKMDFADLLEKLAQRTDERDRYKMAYEANTEELKHWTSDTTAGRIAAQLATAQAEAARLRTALRIAERQLRLQSDLPLSEVYKIIRAALAPRDAAGG